ncbi:MAG: type II toxin-antitoxin system YoeB family toxin [Candidatus Anammoxibacter sp.]
MQSTNWTIKLTRRAKVDLKFWKNSNSRIYQKCIDILKQMEYDPTNLKTTGNPEWLKGKLSGCMSHKISKTDRCVYQVLGENKIIKKYSG